MEVTACSHCGGTGEEPTNGNGKNLPAKRTSSWVVDRVKSLTEADWKARRVREEALVVFDFWRWRHQKKLPMTWSQKRERDTEKLVQLYGLVRVLLAVEGQMVHPDFNHKDGTRHVGYDNLIRPEKGPENIEKCSEVAVERGLFRPTLSCIGRLAEKRGWTPSEADQELLEVIA